MRKLFKILFSALFVASLAGAFVACGEDDQPPIDDPNTPIVDPNNPVDPDDGLTAYTVTVESLGGGKIRNAEVSFYDGVDRVAQGITDTDGNVSVRLEAKVYTVRLTSIPVGYANAEAKRTDTNGSPIVFNLESSVITDSVIPAGKIYQPGDVMYDFTAVTSDGKTIKLSEALQEKKMVLINFWATWCQPCASEFPAMVQAYKSEYGLTGGALYSDEVLILALSSYDDNDAVAEYKQTNGYANSFDWGSDMGLGLSTHFTYSGIPTSIFIDRYGVFCGQHTGAYSSASDFIKLFDHYIAEDYKQNPDNNGGGDDNPEIKRPIPTETPEPSATTEAINGEGFNGTYHEERESGDKEYSWPWLTKTEDGKTFIYNSNQGAQSYSFATIYVNFTAKKGDVLTFDYNMDTESDYDILYVILPDDQLYTLSGSTDGKWETCYVYAASEDGEYEVAFLYNTDEANPSNMAIDDIVRITNLRFSTAADVKNAGAELTLINYCATGADTVSNTWTNYVKVGLNKTDGYYHLLDDKGEPNGPYVLAEMNSGTHWSDQSLYAYAYGGVLDFGAAGNVNDLIMDYSYYAANSDYEGYVPVTEELHNALVLIAAQLGGGDNHETHENEWLEMCSYFVYYGVGEEHNPIVGLAPFSAPVLKETTGATANDDLNLITITKNIIPRGFYHLFTPDETAVYRFTSYGDKMPICWVAEADNPEEFLNDDFEDSDTLDFYIVLEKGKTYYVRLDMAFQDDFGSFYLGIENVGDYAKKFARATAGFYTTVSDDMDNLDVKIVMFADHFELNADNEPVIIHKDMSESPVYVNLLSSSTLTDTTTLAAIFDPPTVNGKKQYVSCYVYDTDGNVVDRDGDGEYDTQELIYEGEELEFLKTKIEEAKNNEGELNGYAVVDERLMGILVELTHKISDMRNKGNYVEDEWLMFCNCYYEYKA